MQPVFFVYQILQNMIHNRMKYIIQIFSIILLFASCDPVKRVSKDANKLARIAPFVTKLGYCVPDTIERIETDTITQIDTFEVAVMIPDTIIIEKGDTIRMIQIKREVIQSVKYIRNTITKSIIDTARINQLSKDLWMVRDSLKNSEIKIRDHKKQNSNNKQFIVVLGLTALISILAFMAILRLSLKLKK